MVSGDVIDMGNVSDTVVDASSKLISGIGQIGIWLQALGIIAVVWIIFQIISLIINRRRMKEVYAIKEDMKRIEGKIDDIKKKVRG